MSRKIEIINKVVVTDTDGLRLSCPVVSTESDPANCLTNCTWFNVQRKQILTPDNKHFERFASICFCGDKEIGELS